jgi:hypothetical protein
LALGGSPRDVTAEGFVAEAHRQSRAIAASQAAEESVLMRDALASLDA